MTAQFVPISQRPGQRPESSLEARGVAANVVRRIFADSIDRDTVDRIARNVMLRWDRDTSINLVEAVGDEVRCTECNGAGSYPGAFVQECPVCSGEGVLAWAINETARLISGGLS